MSHIRIDDATFDHSDGFRSTTWEAQVDLPWPGGGTDEGRILVRIDVDGQMDGVYADLSQSGDVAALDRAIAALQEVRDGLIALYAGRNDPGACWQQGGTGRCYGKLGHAGDHEFPSEDQWRALHTIRTTAVAS